MRFLLDTDICVFWLRGHEPVRKHLTTINPATIAISVITLAELRYGADCSARPAGNHRAVDDFISALMLLGIDPETAGAFGKIKAQLRKEGNLIEDFDLLIAATAQMHNLTLVTNNWSHFSRIPDLRLQNWAQPPR